MKLDNACANSRLFSLPRLCWARYCRATAMAADGKPVVVGSTNFTEQLILANIYADVLEARGVDVKKRLNLGSREVVFPALKSGELDVLPEYSGALVGFLTNGKSKAHKQQAVLEELRQKLPKGLVALKASSAQDKDGIVVTAATAKKYHLKTIADLKPVAGKLTLGGPPETKTRYVGVPGLKQVYGVQFKNFRSLDAGGPLTQSALSSGAIDAARMFTTQGVIPGPGLGAAQGQQEPRARAEHPAGRAQGRVDAEDPQGATMPSPRS